VNLSVKTFLASLGLEGEWKQTSYNNKLSWRLCFKQVGHTDSVPQPMWTLDENNDWQPPTPYPTDGGIYLWNEEELAWAGI
jgi:hypothetical protein